MGPSSVLGYTLLTFKTPQLPTSMFCYVSGGGHFEARREVPEPAVRQLQTRRMPLWNAWDCFITENLVLPVMYDSVHSVLVKQHGYIQWTNCTKNTLLGN